jgi:hypothetical protein
VAPGVVIQPVEDALVLLALESGVYFELDGIGARIWALLGEYGERDTVVDILLEEYVVDEARLRDDVSCLVEKLVDSGLLTVDRVPRVQVESAPGEETHDAT